MEEMPSNQENANNCYCINELLPTIMITVFSICVCMYMHAYVGMFESIDACKRIFGTLVML